MSKKDGQPDEMRMPADQFDKMMRRALGAASPPAQPKKPPRTLKAPKAPKAS